MINRNIYVLDDSKKDGIEKSRKSKKEVMMIFDKKIFNLIKYDQTNQSVDSSYLKDIGSKQSFGIKKQIYHDQ